MFFCCSFSWSLLHASRTVQIRHGPARSSTSQSSCTLLVHCAFQICWLCMHLWFRVSVLSGHGRLDLPRPSQPLVFVFRERSDVIEYSHVQLPLLSLFLDPVGSPRRAAAGPAPGCISPSSCVASKRRATHRSPVLRHHVNRRFFSSLDTSMFNTSQSRSAAGALPRRKLYLHNKECGEMHSVCQWWSVDVLCQQLVSRHVTGSTGHVQLTAKSAFTLCVSSCGLPVACPLPACE